MKKENQDISQRKLGLLTDKEDLFKQIDHLREKINELKETNQTLTTDIQDLKELNEALWIVLREINSESNNSISKLIFAKFIEHLIINIIMIAIIFIFLYHLMINEQFIYIQN